MLQVSVNWDSRAHVLHSANGLDEVKENTNQKQISIQGKNKTYTVRLGDDNQWHVQRNGIKGFFAKLGFGGHLSRSLETELNRSCPNKIKTNQAKCTEKNNDSSRQKSIHDAIDKARANYNHIEQTCLLDACAASNAIANKEFHMPETLNNYYNTIGFNDQFDMNTFIMINDLGGNFGVGDIKIDEKDKKEEVSREQGFNQKVREGTNQKQLSLIKKDKIEIENDNKNISRVTGISKSISDNEIKSIEDHLKEKYPNGCIALRQQDSSGTKGHYVYYHPTTGFITGGTISLLNESSGINTKTLIQGQFGVNRKGALTFWDANALGIGV